MSQVLLGVRNLSVRIAIFVALAAVFVWILGGSLFPRPDAILHGTVEVGRAGEGLGRVRLVEIVHPLSTLPSERVVWILEVEGDTPLGYSRFEPCATMPVLVNAGGLVSIPDESAFRTAYFAGRKAGSDAWSVFAIGGYESCPRELHAYPDRLEAERQIARAVAGLEIQDPATAASARDAVLRAGMAARPTSEEAETDMPVTDVPVNDAPATDAPATGVPMRP